MLKKMAGATTVRVSVLSPPPPLDNTIQCTDELRTYNGARKIRVRKIVLRNTVAFLMVLNSGMEFS